MLVVIDAKVVKYLVETKNCIWSGPKQMKALLCACVQQ